MPLFLADGVSPGATRSQRHQHGEGRLRRGGWVEAEDRARLWMGFWEVGENHMRGTHSPQDFPCPGSRILPIRTLPGAFSQTAAQNPGVQATMGIRGKQVP